MQSGDEGCRVEGSAYRTRAASAAGAVTFTRAGVTWSALQLLAQTRQRCEHHRRLPKICDHLAMPDHAALDRLLSTADGCVRRYRRCVKPAKTSTTSIAATIPNALPPEPCWMPSTRRTTPGRAAGECCISPGCGAKSPSTPTTCRTGMLSHRQRSYLAVGRVKCPVVVMSAVRSPASDAAYPAWVAMRSSVASKGAPIACGVLIFRRYERLLTAHQVESMHVPHVLKREK